MFSGRSLRIFRSVGHFMVVVGASMYLNPKLIIIYTDPMTFVRADLLLNLKIPLSFVEIFYVCNTK